MDKKASTGIIIGAVIALVVIGGIILYLGAKGSQNSTGTESGSKNPGQQVQVNSGSQNTGGSSETGSGDFSWCNGGFFMFQAGQYEFKGVTTYKGQKACHAILNAGGGGTQEYYILSSDGKNFWQKVNYPGAGISAEYHMVNGKCVEGDCSLVNG